MQRITTPTREVDKFGVGKDGFKGGGPPDATQLEPSWFDNVQEELARVIEGQGEVLDGLNLEQLKVAIDDYSFVNPSITDSLTVENGARINVLAGGTLFTDIGSNADIKGAMTVTGSFLCGGSAEFTDDVILGDGAGDLITVNGSMDCLAPVNLLAGAFLGSQTITGTAGSLVVAESMDTSALNLDPNGVPGVDRGDIRMLNNVLTVGQGSFARAIDDSSKGFDDFHQSANPIADTDAEVTREISATEPVLVLVVWNYECSGLTLANHRIRVTGPLGQVEPLIDVLYTDTANARYSGIASLLWTPTDDFPAETDPEEYVFLFRLGTTGSTITADNISIFCFPAITT